MAATLSVSEILMDVLDAFKLELFPISGWTTDFSSDTAVMNDQIIGHIALIPTTATYDPVTGFANGATAASNLLADVTVTMNQLRHCPVVVKYLNQLQSKLPLYRETTRNTGFALAKYVMDYALSKVVAANFTTAAAAIPAANFNLDALEAVRTQCNTMKMNGVGRFGILSSAYAQALQNDDRVKSDLFYAQLNGDRGYRVFKNIAGFSTLVEYPDLPTATATATIGGFFCDSRAVVLASRQVEFGNVAPAMGIPEIGQFASVTEPETGLTLSSVAWQNPGTFDVNYSTALLFGVGAGTNGGAAGTGTDNAGLIVKTA